MRKRTILPLIIIVTAVLVAPTFAQSTARSGLYQIVSGVYAEHGGFPGSIVRQLPNANQSFIRLSVNSQPGDPTMTILGADMQTAFSLLTCPPGPRVPFTFDHGFASSNRIVFVSPPIGPPTPAWWDYTVSNSADSLRIDGVLTTDPGFCVDIPNRFTHTNVVAVFMPVAGVHVSEVEVCWDAFSNRTYQVQYRSTLTTNMWTDLGPPRPGKGSFDCVNDRVQPGQPQRFYRIIIVP
jgi:hypothetical protein